MITRTTLDKYNGKSELEKLKIFLHTVELYSRLLEHGKTPYQIYRAIDEKFTKYLINGFQDIINKVENNSFNYDEEREKLGIEIEIDALVYACDRLNIQIDSISVLAKRREKMVIRKR